MTQSSLVRPQVLTLHNGDKVKPTFSAAEMQARIDKLRGQLRAQGIDAALFTSIHNINYYADFMYCAFGRSYGLVITERDHTTVSANIDYGQPWRQSFGDNLTYTDWQRDNFFVALKELLPATGTVGIESDHLTVQNRDKLGKAFPQLQFVDIAPACMALRMIKSSEEIDLIRNGAAVCDIGGAAVVEAMDAGVPEYEVALHSTQAMVREIARRYPHTELMDTWTWFQSGPNTDGAHNPVTTRKLEKGDILSLNCFAMISGYYIALERTLFLDSATDRQRAVWELNCQVHRRGMELIRPGARCMDIANELNEMFREHDLLQHRTFGYGHSFGSLCHYYGREAGLELREDIDTVLQPNMVISMEPMVTLPLGEAGAGGYREHDILLVTESGSEDLTGFPFGPEHNIIPAS